MDACFRLVRTLGDGRPCGYAGALVVYRAGSATDVGRLTPNCTLCVSSFVTGRNVYGGSYCFGVRGSVGGCRVRGVGYRFWGRLFC